MVQDMICVMCPNGCHLTATIAEDASVSVSGDQCDKGLAFVRRVLSVDGLRPSGRITSQGRGGYPVDMLAEVARLHRGGVS